MLNVALSMAPAMSTSTVAENFLLMSHHAIVITLLYRSFFYLYVLRRLAEEPISIYS